MLQSVINHLSRNSMQDILFREVFSNNTPHVLIVRNADEFVDQSISQFGNTAAFFGMGLLLNRVLDSLPMGVRRISGLKRLGRPLTADQRLWFHFGKSLGIFSMIASTMLAMPFLRNYITTRRTGTTDYAQMIGEKQRTPHDAQTLTQTLDRYKNRFLRTMGLGTALLTTVMAGTMGLVAANKSVPAVVRFLHQGQLRNGSWLTLRKILSPLKRPLNQRGLGGLLDQEFFSGLGLAGGDFNKFNPWSAVMAWVIPTYAGLLSGARDGYEVKELALRFGAFNLAFFVFPFTVEAGINRLAHQVDPCQWVEKVTSPAFRESWSRRIQAMPEWTKGVGRFLGKTLNPGSRANVAYMGRFLSSVVFCSAVPTVLNIYLTHQRVARDKRKASQSTDPFSVASPMGQTPFSKGFLNQSLPPWSGLNVLPAGTTSSTAQLEHFYQSYWERREDKKPRGIPIPNKKPSRRGRVKLGVGIKRVE